jgi:phospholipid/cholesterol/gamma-HCH transport system permease protein
VLHSFINHLGLRTIYFVVSYYKTLLFSSTVLLNLLLPANYNSRIMTRFIRQVYHISMRSIATFSIMAIVFGSLILGLMMVVATQLNLELQIGKVLVGFVMDEFAALFSAFYIAYRLTPTIHQRVSHLTFESNLQTLHNLIISQTLSAIVSTFFLSILFSLLMILSGYLFAFFLVGIDLHTYKYIIFSSLEVGNIFIVLFKSIFFGFIVSVVPLYSALQEKTQKHNTSKVFIVLLFMEALLLLFQKAFYAVQ